MSQLKQAIRQGNWEQQCLAADSLYEQLSPSLQQCFDLAKESGSSSWLTVLPVQEHAFHLHKGDFRDALSLRYGLLPLHTAKTCHCGTSFSIYHAMVCPFGGFPTFHHNEVRDLTATLLTEVCHNVATEPPLQPITAKTFPYATANTADDACLDVKARAFGAGDRLLSWMYMYFIQMLPVIIQSIFLLPTKAMKILRNVNIAIRLEKLSMVSLPYLCLLLLAVWVGR